MKKALILGFLLASCAPTYIYYRLEIRFIRSSTIGNLA